jgi:hypothetical protein
LLDASAFYDPILSLSPSPTFVAASHNFRYAPGSLAHSKFLTPDATRYARRRWRT